MNIVFEADTYKVPAFALPALVNGDYTGILDDDEAFIDNLCEWLNGQYGEGLWHIGEVGEQYFGRADFENLLGDVRDVEIVYKLVEEV